jgi:hypothetical protein
MEELEALLDHGIPGGEEEEGDGRRVLLHAAVSAAVVVLLMVLEEEQQRQHQHCPHQMGPMLKKRRVARRQFDYRGAYSCIMRDHLRPHNPLFGKEFIHYFRLSRTRVQMILEDFGRYGDINPFYKTFRVDMFGRVGASLEAKVLLPLKTLAYGVAPHCFCDYFQVSKPMARECYKHFLDTMCHHYMGEYLGLPTSADLRNIVALHKRVHGVDGMIGSLDCMQTKWKNCPVAWQQSFKGRSKGMSTITLEAAADYNLWFWHAAYGFSGALNDVNVLNLSPLLDRMTNGTFTALEAESGVIPFFIDGEIEGFNKTYFLVDGIYPRYTRFVKGMKEPILEEDKRFTKWQESARKDIERAFGVLQCKFKAIAYPIYFMDLRCVYNMAACCLIMHNMGVQERVMESCTVRYDPSVEADPELEVENAARFPPGVNLPREALAPAPPVRLIRDLDRNVAISILRQREFIGLRDTDEWGRLQAAMIRFKGRRDGAAGR